MVGVKAVREGVRAISLRGLEESYRSLGGRNDVRGLCLKGGCGTSQRDLRELGRLEKELMRSARELERLWRVFGTPGNEFNRFLKE